MNSLEKHIYNEDCFTKDQDLPALKKTIEVMENHDTDELDLLGVQLQESDEITQLCRAAAALDFDKVLNILSDLKRLSESNLSTRIKEIAVTLDPEEEIDCCTAFKTHRELNL